jgi:hypothetical protein
MDRRSVTDEPDEPDDWMSAVMDDEPAEYAA